MGITAPEVPQITEAGIAAALSAKAVGIDLPITSVAFGGARYKPTGKEKALVNERLRLPIKAAFSAPGNNLQMFVDVRALAGGSFDCGEIGFFSGDTLFALVALPAGTSEPLMRVSDVATQTTAYMLTLAPGTPTNVTVVVDINAPLAWRMISQLSAPTGASMAGFIQTGDGAFVRTMLDKARDALSTADFPAGVQAAVDEAIKSGRQLVIEPGTAVPPITINGRVSILAKGVISPDYDGRRGAWISVSAAADGSQLAFEEIDFKGVGMMGISLDASRCRVLVGLAKNMVAQTWDLVHVQGVVTSQGSDNIIDVTAHNFDVGATGGAHAVPRIVTTEVTSARNQIRVRATKCHTVWVENGTNNTAEYVIADACTDNAIYNLDASDGMKCEYLQYTNGRDEPFVIEGKNAWIGKSVYDGWGFPGLQNATNLVLEDICLLPSPDGTPSNVALRSRDGNVQSDVRIGRITGYHGVGIKQPYTYGSFLQFYVGNVDIRVGSIDLNVKYHATSATPIFVLHRQGAIAEYGDVRITFDDSDARPPGRMSWQTPSGARASFRTWQLDPRSYPYLGVSNVTAANVFLPVGQELVGSSILQNASAEYPPARLLFDVKCPVSGTWNRGDVVHNKFPITGSATGWKCIAASSPAVDDTPASPGSWMVMGQAGIGRGPSTSRPTAASMGVTVDASWAGTMWLDTSLAAEGRLIMWSGLAWVVMQGTSDSLFTQSGAGAVPRSLEKKAREEVSATDFSFVPGSYAAAIRKTIAEVAKLDNAIVIIPRRGTFELEAPVFMGVDTGIHGKGQESTNLTWAGTGPAIIYRPEKFNPYSPSLRHLSIKGAGVPLGGGVEVSDTLGFIFEDVGISGFTSGDGVTLRNINWWTEGTEFHGVRIGNNKRQLVLKRDRAPATATGSFGYTKMLNASLLLKDGQQGIVVGDDTYNTAAHDLYNSILNVNIWQEGNSQAWVFGRNGLATDIHGLGAGEIDSTFTGVFVPANTATSGFRNSDIFLRSSPLGKPENQYSQVRDLRYKKFRDIGAKAPGTGTTRQWFKVARLGPTKGIFMGHLFTQSQWGLSSSVSGAATFAFGLPGHDAAGFLPIFQVTGDAFELGDSHGGQAKFKIASDAAGDFFAFFQRPAWCDVCQWDYSYDYETGATYELWTPSDDPATIDGMTVVWDSYLRPAQQMHNGDELVGSVQRLVLLTNGSTTNYSAPHNYVDSSGHPVAPEYYTVEALNDASTSVGIKSVTVDETTLNIEMTGPTPAGTGNVKFGITLGRKNFWKNSRPK